MEKKYKPELMFPKFTSGDWRWIVLADSGSDRDNYLWIILLKRRRYLKIYLIQDFLLHKFTVAQNKNSQTLMAVRLDYQPIRSMENSSSGSMYKTNQRNNIANPNCTAIIIYYLLSISFPFFLNKLRFIQALSSVGTILLWCWDPGFLQTNCDCSSILFNRRRKSIWSCNKHGLVAGATNTSWLCGIAIVSDSTSNSDQHEDFGDKVNPIK